MVEEEGVEFYQHDSSNAVIAHDFWLYVLTSRGLRHRILSSRVHSGPPESTPVLEKYWRRLFEPV